MRSYDDWKCDDRFDDAPLHTECAECWAQLDTVHEEYAGVCLRCERLEHLVAEEEADAA